MDVANKNPTSAAPAPTAAPVAEENPSKEFFVLGGSTALVAVGAELLTNEYEKMRQAKEVTLDQLSAEKIGLAVVKGLVGYYAYEKIGGMYARGAALGLATSALADVVEVIGWQMNKA